MRKYLHYASFILPFAALVAAATFYQKNEVKTNLDTQAATKTASVSTYSHSDSSISNTSSNTSTNTNINSEIQSYKMIEPFSTKLPGEGFAEMHNTVNPFMWMELMTHMMNHMMAMPFQMMPMMGANAWGNPSHSYLPNQAFSPLQPMSPKEYEKLYNEKKKVLNTQE